MKSKQILLALVVMICTHGGIAWAGPVLKVVTTLPDYRCLAEAIGGDRISVQAISNSVDRQDKAHLGFGIHGLPPL